RNRSLLFGQRALAGDHDCTTSPQKSPAVNQSSRSMDAVPDMSRCRCSEFSVQETFGIRPGVYAGFPPTRKAPEPGSPGFSLFPVYTAARSLVNEAPRDGDEIPSTRRKHRA